MMKRGRLHRLHGKSNRNGLLVIEFMEMFPTNKLLDSISKAFTGQTDEATFIMAFLVRPKSRTSEPEETATAIKRNNDRLLGRKRKSEQY